jgi:hypothetical protein
MYTEHPVYLDPEGEAIRLYRYMDFTKFVSVIQKKELYFCPVDKLDDPFEGSFPQKEIEYHKRNGYWDEIAPGFKTRRGEVFINCWHYNEQESAGMWRLYSQIGKGIAIQTTIPKLKEAFKVCQKNIYIGKVIYIDYTKDFFYKNEPKGYDSLNFGVPFIHKRNIFEAEKEYRAVYISHESKSIERPYFQMDLDTLIENVIVAPKCEDWLFELTANLLNQFLPDKRVIRSIHDQEPFS